MKHYLLAIDISTSRRHENFEDMNLKAIEAVISEMETKKNFALHVLGYDLGVFNHEVFLPKGLDRLRDYKITFGGVEGSYLESVTTYMAGIGVKLHRMFLLTDENQDGVRMPCRTTVILERDQKELVYR
jgi:hypothetical protein